MEPPSMTPNLNLESRCPVAQWDSGKIAIEFPDGDRSLTYAQFEDRTRRLAAGLLSRGLVPGESIAILSDNRLEYLEIAWAGHRAGLYVVPINSNLTADEGGYILQNSETRAVFTTSALADRVLDPARTMGYMDAVSLQICLDADRAGSLDYEEILQDSSDGEGVDKVQGSLMLYSSGTTGRPKGIKRALSGAPFGQNWMVSAIWQQLHGVGPTTRYLSPAPMYHSAPIGYCLSTLWLGGSVVMMRKFDAETALELIEAHAISHVQFVPTHLVRLLRLPKPVRDKYDLSSLKVVVSAGAPCSPDIKAEINAWLGPKLFEYYGGSETVGLCAITPREAANHVGSVGRSLMGRVHILDDDGKEQPPLSIGQVWFEGASHFEYHRDAAKTSAAWNDRGWASYSDIGYIDDDGFLYLTDRVGETIISGGVNIYPKEIEDVLISNEFVADVGVIGMPDKEFGESVVAFVQLAAGVDSADALDVLMTDCRKRLAGFKVPRKFVFVDDLPRTPSGKMLRRELRRRTVGVAAGPDSDIPESVTK